MFATLRTTEPRSAAEQAAYGKWLDQRTDREDARADRTHGAEGVIPDPLWIVLFLSAGIIFVFMLFFADSAARDRASDHDGQRRDRDHVDAASARVPRSPVQSRAWVPAPGGDGADPPASQP